MTRALFTLAFLLASPSARAELPGKALFEDKCLYCHSAAPIFKQRRTAPEWKKVIARMRSHAPLLIDGSQAATILSYLTATMSTTPRPVARPRRRPETRPEARPEPEPEPEPVVAVAPEPPTPVEEPAQPADPEAEAAGPRLLEQRCSKCHSTYRVYTKIDKLSIGLAVIERMRHKTGANITPADADMLRRFLRTRIAD